MFDILGTVMAAIVVAHFLRWGYLYIVKRQRLDWTLERRRFKQEQDLMLRIMKRMTRWYWRG